MSVQKDIILGLNQNKLYVSHMSNVTCVTKGMNK